MQILQQLLEAWPSLNNFVSMLETLSMPFLIMFGSCIITISTFLCRTLRLLMNLSVAFLTKVKKLLSKQQLPQQKTQDQVAKLQKRLDQLQQELKLVEEVKKNEQSGLFKIQR